MQITPYKGVGKNWKLIEYLNQNSQDFRMVLMNAPTYENGCYSEN